VSLLSVAELQAQVETDLANATLQIIIDAAEREITEQIGPTTGYVKDYDAVQYVTEIRFPVEADTVTTAVEYTDGQSDPTKTTLAADDYEISEDGWWLRRLSDGTNQRSSWGWHVVITFEPVADTDRRKQAAVQLSRLQIVHTGYSRERAGDWAATNLDYRREKGRILSDLDLVKVS